jgi:hypothetical protein
LQVCADLQIEELTMAKTTPATALLSSSAGGKGTSNGARPPSTPCRTSREARAPLLGAPLDAASAVGRSTRARAPTAPTLGVALAPAAGPAVAAVPPLLQFPPTASNTPALVVFGPATRTHGWALSIGGLGPTVCLDHPLGKTRMEKRARTPSGFTCT